MTELDIMIKDYSNNLNYIPLIFQKKCGYKFVILFFKNTTTCNDIYKIIDNLYNNNKLNCLYIDNLFIDNLFIERLDELFFNKYKQYLQPIYPLPDRISYKLKLDDNHI